MNTTSYFFWTLLFVFYSSINYSQSCCVCRTPPYESDDSICYDYSSSNCNGNLCNDAQCRLLTGNALAISLVGACQGSACPMTCPIIIPLPVELVRFEVSFISDVGVKIKWRTLSELNNYGFEIEKSIDASNWEKLTFIEGNGTTTTAQEYNFIDKYLADRVIYYRLKQIDFDGGFAYSRIISIDITNIFNEIVYYPNPVKDFLHLKNFDGIVYLCSMDGQIIFQKELINDGDHRIDIRHIPNGIYLLKVIYKTGNTVIHKLMKRR